MVDKSKEPQADYGKTIRYKLHFADILRYVVIFAIVVVMIFHFTEDAGWLKKKNNHYWQLTNAAYGKSDSGGDRQAPNNEPNLASIVYMAANFSGDHLEGRDLSMKTFTLTIFPGARLQKASLRCSAFVVTDFSGAQLQNADMSGAAFLLTNFSGAQLQNANLSGTKFRLALFAGAQMQGVNLEGADLAFANIRGINNWRQIRSIKNANIYKIKSPPAGFVEWAMQNGAVSISPSEQWERLSNEKAKG
jgi:hypothetical protein